MKNRIFSILSGIGLIIVVLFTVLVGDTKIDDVIEYFKTQKSLEQIEQNVKNDETSVKLDERSEKEKVYVERVIDGDTFIAKKDGIDNAFKVQLLNIDTPETVKPNTPIEPYGKKASIFTKKIIEDKDVILEYDEEMYDKYGRRLAYVWLNDKKMLNEMLIDRGLAKTMFVAPNQKYLSILEKRESIAHSKKVGIWST